MLILTRRMGESIIINDDIKVTVLDVQGQQVRLGIVAPKDVPVNRKEIQERIDSQRKQEAAKLPKAMPIIRKYKVVPVR